MKTRIFALIAALAFVCCMLAACGGDKTASSSTVSYSKDPINDYIRRADITEIEVKSSAYVDEDEPFETIYPDKSEWHEIIDILGSYSLTVSDDQSGSYGYNYFFTIKQNGSDEPIYISIGDDMVTVNGVNYTSTKSLTHDFDYLFEAG